MNKFRRFYYHNIHWKYVSPILRLRYDIPAFFSNLWRFRKTLWQYRTWDDSGLYVAMRDSLQGLYECQSDTSLGFRSVNADKYAKHIKVCIELLDRQIADDYYIRSHNFKFNREAMLSGGSSFTPQNSEQPVNPLLYHNMEKWEREYLFKMLCKHSKSWWH